MEESQLIDVYRECVVPLYFFVSRRCGTDRGLAEDVTQEAWLRAVESWKKKGLPQHPLAWLKVVARNLLLNYFRRASVISIESLPPDWEGALLGNGGSEEPSDHSAALSWGLARLKPAQARLIEAFHLDGKRIGDIASELGMSERAVEGRLRRARLKLKKTLEPMVGSAGGVS
jgi:RNA polymerase sigma-70 factor (ECF subfamily)